LLASSLIAVTGQRLVRRLCPKCRVQKRIDPAHAKRLNLPVNTMVFEAKGCEACGNIGYKGRSPISEVLLVDSGVRSAILHEPTPENIAKVAGQEYKMMMHDGLEKVIQGDTTIDEVLRVVG
jgi:type II secretory ATPase GspE/PulE/Tfp pilus assembly ATPase PilB-like protein